MARQLNRLSALKVARTTASGLYADGGGLYLRVSSGASSGKRWVFIYRRRSDGKRCEMGLGGVTSVPLATARKLAAEARGQLAQSIDPLQTRAKVRSVLTFGAASDELIKSLGPSWRNEKHRAQWVMTLQHYAGPLRDRPVNEITTSDVLEVLRPIWLKKSETAARVRGRIERVLDAAKAQGHRTGENPAAWKGHLSLLLPSRPKLKRGHHARIPIDDVPQFMTRLRAREGVAGRCLEFLILTAARSNEAISARWTEMSLGDRIWVVPAERMKSNKEHRIPLSQASLDVLNRMKGLDKTYVFPGQRRDRPLSTGALDMLLRRMGVEDATVHGFRSSFRDWAGNRTAFPRELAEHALAHTIGDKAEQAYRRDDAVERRRPLMEAWAEFCNAGKTDLETLGEP